MPSQEKRHTLLRQWALLKAIPAYSACPVGKTARELTEILRDEGFDIDVRSTQRDLIELAGLFPIEANDKSKPFGWRWLRQTHIGIPGLSLTEALALRLVESHLRQLMPSTLLGSLNGLFKLAGEQLAALQGKNASADWPSKVRSVPPTQPLIPSDVSEGIHAALSHALLEGWQIRVRYRPAGDTSAKEYVLHPLGMVLRGAVLYLVATAFDYQDIRTYALHRFETVERLLEPVSVPPGFNLDAEIAKGMAEFGEWGETLPLELLCDPDLSFHLAETPLSSDQQMVKTDGDMTRVTATVSNTWQLRWWLLSQGAKVEVLGPACLRSEMARELERAARRYD